MLRPLTDLGDLGYLLLIVSGVVVAVRRRWPVAVFVDHRARQPVYYTLDFPDGPGWLGLFVALYTLTAHGDGRRSLVIAGVGHHGADRRLADRRSRHRATRRHRLGVLPDRGVGDERRPGRVGPIPAGHRCRRTGASRAGPNGPARRKHGPGSTTNGCGSHARSTTPSLTPSPSSTSRPASPRTCSTSDRSRRARRWRPSSRPAPRRCRRCGPSSACSATTTTGECRTRASDRSTNSSRRHATPDSTSTLESAPPTGGTAERGGQCRLPNPAGVDHQRDPPRRSDPGDGQARLRRRLPGDARDR